MRIDFSEIYAKVRLYLSVGRFEAAEKLVQSALDEHGSTANLHNMLGVIYHKQSKFADAIVQFTKSLKINPNFVEAGLNLSVTFCDLGRYDDARAVFQDVLAQTPTNKRQPDLVLGRLANHHAECGRLYEQSGMMSDAIQEYRKALGLYDRMPDVRLALGRLYFRSGQFDRALQEFQTVVSQHPDEPDCHLWLGIAHWKLGHQDQAVKLWEAAQALGGEQSTAHIYLQMSKRAEFNPSKLSV